MAAKQGIFVLNSPGTVDANYRGEVGVILANLSGDPVTIMPGDRIAQLVPKRLDPIRLEFVEELGFTDRGSKGFGSSGI